jgi:BON domain-containing protein
VAQRPTERQLGRCGEVPAAEAVLLDEAALGIDPHQLREAARRHTHASRELLHGEAGHTGAVPCVPPSQTQRGFVMAMPGNSRAMAVHATDAALVSYDRAELADVTVDVEDGVAVLRGIVDNPTRRLELERRAFSIDGVEAVENLVQLPSA